MTTSLCWFNITPSLSVLNCRTIKDTPGVYTSVEPHTFVYSPIFCSKFSYLVPGFFVPWIPSRRNIHKDHRAEKISCLVGSSCIGHKRLRAAGLLWGAEEMKEGIYHVTKGCNCLLNVMYNKCEWWWMCNENSTCMLLRKFRREKTLGEMWAAVIKTINNLLRTAWLWMRATDWGQSQSELMLRRGPCWTYSQGASRRR
jgi:hypothetical protein